jgi:hypothetical protein
LRKHWPKVVIYFCGIINSQQKRWKTAMTAAIKEEIYLAQSKKEEEYLFPFKCVYMCVFVKRKE